MVRDGGALQAPLHFSSVHPSPLSRRYHHCPQSCVTLASSLLCFLLQGPLVPPLSPGDARPEGGRGAAAAACRGHRLAGGHEGSCEEAACLGPKASIEVDMLCGVLDGLCGLHTIELIHTHTRAQTHAHQQPHRGMQGVGGRRGPLHEAGEGWQ